MRASELLVCAGQGLNIKKFILRALSLGVFHPSTTFALAPRIYICMLEAAERPGRRGTRRKMKNLESTLPVNEETLSR